MRINTDPRKIKELLERGVESAVKKESLLKKLRAGKKLRIKHGVDPTGPKIHIGRAISFWKLKSFQDMGHQVVLVIGDFTAQIGDASDKLSTRRPLTEKEVKENLKTYLSQIGKILDIKRVEVHYNSDWLSKLTAKELTEIATNFTVFQMLSRRTFKQRFEKKKIIGVHEFLYPIYQGYDSVAVKADIEIGGFDQLFNFMAGRKLQEVYGQKPQDIITFKLLYGLDGRKMSTSWENVVNVIDSPEEQYGKIMSMKDDLITNYFELVTKVPLKEIKKIEKKLKTKTLNPRDAKRRLAKKIVSSYYGEKRALKAEKSFERVFKQKKPPVKMPRVSIKEKELNILDLLLRAKMVTSKAEARRLIQQRGVKLDRDVQRDWEKIVKIKKGLIIQVGKRKFAQIR